FKVFQKLKWLKHDLKLLNKKKFSNIQVTTTKAHSDLMLAQRYLHTDPMKKDLSRKEREASLIYNEA
ncbi:MAG: hypothetical protein Q8877_02530, partial [Sweet potato little leaf phytoplasma]|nr:hypothetical protein [Sweet potato little leaf phytoplasma]